ncbi:hypothetical protein [Empedobacter brevis]|uniref:hypothetical protein n=1 Tax=Empedobacter brevis TaxID=247 RepID=UPI0039AF3E75
MRFIGLYFFNLLLSCNLNGQYEVKKIPSIYINDKIVKDSSSNYSNAESAVSYLPINYVQDASVDYTDNIQEAINKNEVIILPNFPILINDNGIKLKNNTILIFNKKSKFILKPSDKQGYGLININNISNVKIFNMNIVGDRKNHLSNKGEWGMGVNIINSKNVFIYNSNIKDFWGDGIYIGGNNFSSNINILGGLIDNNRRNGISIISGKKILLKKLLISNTNGANPQTGLDIEPNTEINKIIDLIVEDVTTFNNFNSGTSLYINNLKGYNTSNNVNIYINNYNDIDSKYGMSFYNLKSEKKKGLKGNIILKNINLINNNIPLRFRDNNFSLDNIELEYNNIKVNNKIDNNILIELKSLNKNKIKRN